MITSSWVMVSVSVLATFWDVYHSALQTFGFARIYDRKLGNDPTVGRRLDFLMQELNREANTLGSKSAVAGTTQASVDLKVLIEQIREQIQNLE